MPNSSASRVSAFVVRWRVGLGFLLGAVVFWLASAAVRQARAVSRQRSMTATSRPSMPARSSISRIAPTAAMAGSGLPLVMMA
jgi:hypothetical protein